MKAKYTTHIFKYPNPKEDLNHVHETVSETVKAYITDPSNHESNKYTTVHILRLI